MRASTDGYLGFRRNIPGLVVQANEELTGCGPGSRTNKTAL